MLIDRGDLLKSEVLTEVNKITIDKLKAEKRRIANESDFVIFHQTDGKAFIVKRPIK